MIAPNPSCYASWPVVWNKINFRRSLLFAQAAADCGITVAPNIYWQRLEDLQRYQRWMDDTEPAYLAVNLQTFRTDWDWERFGLPGLTFLSMVAPPTTTWVFQGTSRFARIKKLQELFGDRMVLIAQKAQQAAMHGEVMTAKGPVVLHAKAPDAFRESVRFYSSLFGPGDAGRTATAGVRAVLPGSAGDPAALFVSAHDADLGELLGSEDDDVDEMSAEEGVAVVPLPATG